MEQSGDATANFGQRAIAKNSAYTLVTSDVGGGVIRVYKQTGNLYEENLAYNEISSITSDRCEKNAFGTRIVMNEDVALIQCDDEMLIYKIDSDSNFLTF